VGVGDGEGDGLGVGAGEGDGDGDADGLGEGEAVGLPDGDALGDALGEALGDGDGEEQVGWVPVRKISCPWSPHPRVMPLGCEYQSRVLRGREFTKRAMTVVPTFSPYARMMPPPPFGAVLPTHTPTTMSGL